MYDPTLYSNGHTAAPRDATQAPLMYAEGAEVERNLTLRDLLRILWKRLWVIVLMALVFVGAAVGSSFWQTPVYEASATLLVGQKQGKIEQPNLMSSVEGLQQLTHTVVEAVDSRPIAEEVVQQQGLQMTPQDLLDNLAVEQVEDTQFVGLSYRDTDPEKAQEIINHVGDVSSERISEAVSGTDSITVSVWDPAPLPEAPVSPDPVRDAFLALGLGLMFGIGLAFLLEGLDTRWRSAEEVEQASGAPVFGVIPEFEVAKNGGKRSRIRTAEGTGTTQPEGEADANFSQNGERKSSHGEVVTIQDPAGAASEAYRMLRTNLFYTRVDIPPKAIVLASADHNEGKSTTAANLGVALAQAGKDTLILDCDLRRPVQHKIFGTRNLVGLVDVVIGNQELREVWQEPIPGLKLVPAGATPPNPAELLSSQRFAELLGQMRQEFDYVLIDTPPMERAAEAAALAANGDGVLLILDTQHTRKGSLRRTLRRLQSVGATLLGTVMNNNRAVTKGKAAADGYSYIDGY